MQKVYGRREFIGKHFFFSSVFWGTAAVLSACDSKRGSQKKEKNAVKTDPCEDLSGVSENDIEARTKLGYVKKSSFPDKVCSNCNLHIPPAAGKECGGCLLF